MALPLSTRLETLLTRLVKQDRYGFFFEPVDVSAFPDYMDAIQPRGPMDFATMSAKISRREYTDLEAFQEDFSTIIENCTAYNPPGSIYHREALKLRSAGDTLIDTVRRKLDEERRKLAVQRAAEEAAHYAAASAASSSVSRAAANTPSSGSGAAATASKKRKREEEEESKPRGRGRGRPAGATKPSSKARSPSGSVDGDLDIDDVLETSVLAAPAHHRQRRVRVLPSDYHPDEDQWVCAVCDDNEAYDNNALIMCGGGNGATGCGVVVHQVCYGVQEVPAGDWLCEPCACGLDTASLVCALCPTAGGALKPTDRGLATPQKAGGAGAAASSTTDGVAASEWAHILCASYVPEVHIGDTMTMRPVVGLETINPRRSRLACKVCKKASGAVVQCSHAVCGFAVHATCARQAGLEMGWQEERKGVPGHYAVHCNRHADRDPDDPLRMPFRERVAFMRAKRRLDMENKLGDLKAERERLAARLARYTERSRGRSYADQPKQAAKKASEGGWEPSRAASGAAAALSAADEAAAQQLSEAAEAQDGILSLLPLLSEHASKEDADYDSASDEEGPDRLRVEDLRGKQRPAEVPPKAVDEEGSGATAEAAKPAGPLPKRRGRPPKKLNIPQPAAEGDAVMAQGADTGRFQVSMCINAPNAEAAWPLLMPYFMRVSTPAAVAALARFMQNHDAAAWSPEQATREHNCATLLDVALLAVRRNLNSLREKDALESGSKPTATWPPPLTADPTMEALEAAVAAAVKSSEEAAAKGKAHGSGVVPAHAWVKLLQSALSRVGNSYPSFLTTPAKEVDPRILASTAYKPVFQAESYCRTYDVPTMPDSACNAELSQPLPIRHLPPVTSQPEAHMGGLHVVLDATGSSANVARALAEPAASASAIKLPQVAFDPQALASNAATDPVFASPPLGRHYLLRWAYEDGGDMSSSAPMGGTPGSPPPLGSDGDPRAAAAALEFSGWCDGLDFHELRNTIAAEFTPTMAAVMAAAKEAGVCKDTTFRFANADDARLIHVLNRVNDAFTCPEDFRISIKAKNEFVLLAVRRVLKKPAAAAATSSAATSTGAVSGSAAVPASPAGPAVLGTAVPGLAAPLGMVNDEYEEHIVGFINWYSLWFKGSSSNAFARVMYVATLQAVKADTHSDICAQSVTAMTPSRSRSDRRGERGTPSRVASSTPSAASAAVSAASTTVASPGVGQQFRGGMGARDRRKLAHDSTGSNTPRDKAGRGAGRGLSGKRRQEDGSGGESDTSAGEADETSSRSSKAAAAADDILDPEALLDADPAVMTKRWYPYTTKNPGAEARCGTMLLALALAHGRYAGLSALLVDSTDGAKDYYLRVIGMAPLEQRTGHSYWPMYLALRDCDPVALTVPPSAQRAAAGGGASSGADGGNTDEILREMQETQACLAATMKENDERGAQLVARVEHELAARDAPAHRQQRRFERRLWTVYGGEEQRRHEKREEERRQSEEDSEAVCACCGGGESSPKNSIMFCDAPGCNLAVHQDCYGVAIVPEKEWFCTPCTVRASHPSVLVCVLCGIYGGPLQPVHVGGSEAEKEEGSSRNKQWAHPHCARLLSRTVAPHIAVAVDGCIIGVHDYGWLASQTGKDRCCVCAGTAGVCVRCSVPGCSGSIHPLCALECGLVGSQPPRAPPPGMAASVVEGCIDDMCCRPYVADASLPLHPNKLAQTLLANNGDAASVAMHIYCAAHRIAFPGRLQHGAHETSDSWVSWTEGGGDVMKRPAKRARGKSPMDAADGSVSEAEAANPADTPNSDTELALLLRCLESSVGQAFSPLKSLAVDNTGLRATEQPAEVAASSAPVAAAATAHGVNATSAPSITQESVSVAIGSELSRVSEAAASSSTASSVLATGLPPPPNGRVGLAHTDEDVCAVCGGPDSEHGNEIVYCDRCNLCVHRQCYGITTLPEAEWMCDPCAAGVGTATEPCCLCFCTGGALKAAQKTNIRQPAQWVHVICALFIPEVSFGDEESLTPVVGVDGISADRRKLKCKICKVPKGAPIQCADKSCKVAYHVTCGMAAGYSFVYDEVPSGDGAGALSSASAGAGAGGGSGAAAPPRRQGLTSPTRTAASEDDGGDVMRLSFCPKHASKCSPHAHRICSSCSGWQSLQVKDTAPPPSSTPIAEEPTAAASARATATAAGSSRQARKQLLPQLPPDLHPMLSRCSAPLSGAPDAFTPLLRILITVYGYYCNFEGLQTAMKVCRRLRPPALRRREDKLERAAADGDTAAAEQLRLAHKRHLYGLGMYVPLDATRVVGRRVSGRDDDDDSDFEDGRGSRGRLREAAAHAEQRLRERLEQLDKIIEELENPPARPPTSSSSPGMLSSAPVGGSRAEVLDSDDSDDEVYCVCNQPSEGDMVACDTEGCNYCNGWFHFSCVGLPETGPPDGAKWYCPRCQQQQQ